MGQLPPCLFIRCEESTTSLSNLQNEVLFPMVKVPVDLQCKIMEKMMYDDFANFNSCSSLTTKMCNSIPSTINLLFHVDCFIFTKETVWYLAFNSSKSLENCLPSKISYVCNTLVINPTVWEMVKHYEIKAEILRIYNYVAASVLGEILQVTKASVLDISTLEHEAYSLTALKQLEKLSFTTDQISDEHLLSLLMPSLTIWTCNLSLSSIIKILQQWICGERIISLVKLTKQSGFKLAQVYEELAKEETISIHPENNGKKYWICKTEDHQNCIAISFGCGSLFVARGDQKCPRAD